MASAADPATRYDTVTAHTARAGLADLRLKDQPEAGVAGEKYTSNDIMVRAADRGMVLKNVPGLSYAQGRTWQPDAGAAEDLLGKVRARISSMRFPDRISSVMARGSGDGSIRILIVHGYESHSRAIAASRRNVDALEEQLPDADFEFSYVKSGRFTEEDSRGFVDMRACPT